LGHVALSGFWRWVPVKAQRKVTGRRGLEPADTEVVCKLYRREEAGVMGVVSRLLLQEEGKDGSR
jgi:hypothetical protein